MARFSINFCNDSDRDLDGLTKAPGVKSKAEVVRKALSRLRYVVQVLPEADRLIIENAEQESRRELLTL